LFVCTGNVCRSPFAEILTRHLLAERLGEGGAAEFTVRSAGTLAVIGAGIDDLTRAELAPWGLDGAAADGVVAHQLDARAARSADLILTAARRHRSLVVELAPTALPKTFCVREFARILGGADTGELPNDPIERAEAMVRLAGRTRGLLSYASEESDAVIDPIGGPPALHHRAAGQITDAVVDLIELLAPLDSKSTSPHSKITRSSD